MNSYFQTCQQHFSLGKYESCLRILEKCPESRSDLSFVQWTVDNNRIVSKILWDVEVKCGVLDNKLIKSTASDLMLLLNQIRSIPVQHESLPLECTVLINYLLMQSLGHGRYSSSVLDNYENHVCRTLQRICRHFSIGDDRDSGKSYGMPESLFGVIFRHISNVLDESMVTCAVSLCCAWSVLLMAAGHLSKSVSCLISCPESVLDSIKVDEPSFVFEVPLSLVLANKTSYGPSSVINPKDKAQFLYGLYLFCTPGRQCSKTILQDVKGIFWQQYTKYMLAYIEFEDNQYFDAMVTLSHVTKTDDNKLKALHSSLFAACFSKLEKHHCAIEKNKEALTLDFHFLWPLYSLSLEYQSLGLYNAELESLNLLITALDMNREEPVHQCLLYRCLCPPDQQITQLQAQYKLAKRCLQLHRFEDASQRYLTVLNLMDQIDTFQEARGRSELVLPSVLTVFHETEYSLLKAKQYTDCVTVCDKVLSCDAQCQGLSGYHSDQSQDQSLMTSQVSNNKGQWSSLSARESEDLDSQSGMFGTEKRHIRKRLRSEGEAICPLEKYCNSGEDARSFLYKADALVYLGKLDITILKRSLDPMTLLTSDNQLSRKQDTESELPSKRIRLDSHGACAPSSSDGEDCLLPLKHTAAAVYSHLGTAMSKSQNHKDALLYIRISLQLKPDNSTAMYNLTAVLWSLQREREGALSWTKYRGLNVGLDSFHITNVLKKKKEQLRSLNNEVDIPTSGQWPLEVVWDGVSDPEMLQLDVQCLENLLKIR